MCKLFCVSTFFRAHEENCGRVVVVNCFLSILHWNWTRLMMTTRELIYTNTSTARPSNCWNVYFILSSTSIWKSFDAWVGAVRMWMNIMSVSRVDQQAAQRICDDSEYFLIWSHFALVSFSLLGCFLLRGRRALSDRELVCIYLISSTFREIFFCLVVEHKGKKL